ncbi:MAG: metal-sensing transcriptional repressor [Erysipelothrix sp.]|nr:metal-sensing transcriptional repressor [Erysipelothrix sp.]
MNCNPKTYNRIKRLQGQLNGAINMIDEERGCEDVVTQLSAVRSSLDKVISLIVTQNLLETIESKHNIELEDIDSAIALLTKSR